MWKRGGRSSALDRAEAVLSAKKSSTGATEPTRRSVAIAPELTVSLCSYFIKSLKTKYVALLCPLDPQSFSQ